MDRIKNINEVIVPGQYLWCELVIKEKSSLIIDPNAPLNVDYMIVRAVGEHVKDVKVGDIIIETMQKNFETTKLNGKQYVKIMRNLCDIVVTQDNFNTKQK